MPFDTLSESADAALAVVEAPPETRRQTRTVDRTEVRREPNYHVVIWDDQDHSPEYVQQMLRKLFGHSRFMARQITMDVHHRGKGIAKTCHRELAELKRDQIVAYGGDEALSDCPQISMRASIEPAPE